MPISSRLVAAEAISKIGDAAFSDHIFHHEFCHRGTADIAVADEKHFYHNLYIPPEVFKPLILLGFSDFRFFFNFSKVSINLCNYTTWWCSKWCVVNLRYYHHICCLSNSKSLSFHFRDWRNCEIFSPSAPQRVRSLHGCKH